MRESLGIIIFAVSMLGMGVMVGICIGAVIDEYMNRKICKWTRQIFEKLRNRNEP